MRRRKTGRDGFQGYSARAAAAHERIFGLPVVLDDQMPEGVIEIRPTQESPATKPRKSLERLCVAGGKCSCETGCRA
jgi:hypothetical protein